MYPLENHGFARLPPGTPRVLAEVALIALLAFQAAQLTWIAFAPVGPLGTPKPSASVAGDAKLAALTKYDPFAPRSAVLAADPNAPRIEGNMSLFGVRSDGHGGGSAIVGMPGSPQRLYAVGEEIAPGIVLKSTASDYVVLARGNRRAILTMAKGAAAPGAAASPIPSYLTAPRPAQTAVRPASAVSVDPKQLMKEAGLRPRTEDGKVTGYTLLPRGEGDTLRRAGLEAGDVLVALNGSQITPERYAELEQELVSSPQVRITVQRGSETKTIVFQTAR